MTDPAWYQNIAIWAAFFAWMIAQSIKMGQAMRTTHKFDFAVLVSTGGMPSAHSALVCALATSVGLQVGWGTPLFAVAFSFAGIVMFDAQSLRQAAGHQARILNQIVDEMWKDHHLPQDKLKELLGHTQLEVFAGFVTGILTALALHRIVGA